MPSHRLRISAMERFTCRTCLCIADLNSSAQVFEICSTEKTIRDVLLEFVPSMEKTLSKEDRICGTCVNTLKNFMGFLEKCLEIEENYENWSVENHKIIQIGEIVDHDHSYIKFNTEDDTDKQEEREQNNENAPNTNQEQNFEEVEIQLIPVGSVQDPLLIQNLQTISTNPQEPIAPNVTIVATGDELLDDNFIQIKSENDQTSFMEYDGDLGIYQQLADEQSLFICELCGDGFLSKQLLQRHMSVHGELRIMCDKCPKVFRNDSSLKAHYKLKHAPTSLRFKCDFCEQVFARADYLRNHVKKHVNEKKNNVKCRIPGKFLRFKNTDDPLPCKICGKYYNGIQKLKVHLQTHLVVKRFACEYCDLTYKRWPSLKRHEKSHLESDQFFYRCNVCWKRFPKKEELDQHMHQHGSPRYRCQVCDEQFHRKYLFDNHYLLAHATPEDIENSKKEVIYDTLLELSSQNLLVTE
ncbi:unnamed protein product [Phyllotreta striolata]|uniref:C2H2-type domain-containing protein n=1 Tax=Phyllotreta striolata TaxID=444603 RepID=A0A9N9XNX6_PHYSR|nr:unnamed protein product [Phyllotreta striolata]